MSSTNETTQKIINYLFIKGIFAWRSNTTGLFDPVRKMYRTAAKVGVSDILAVFKPYGTLYAIEVKTGKDKLRSEQKGFLRNIQSMGGVSLVVHSFEDFVLQFEKEYGSRTK